MAYAQRNDLPDAVQALYGILSAFGGGKDVALPVGIMLPFPSATPPSGWLACDGSEALVATYPDLAAVLGNTFGTPSTSDYVVLPDMRGRVAGGAGQGSGLTNRAVGDYAGAETHQMSKSEAPIHDHADGQLPIRFGGRSYMGADHAITSSNSVSLVDSVGVNGSAGGDQPHNNMQPTLFLNWIIYGGA